jgi:hypothetical protein
MQNGQIKYIFPDLSVGSMPMSFPIAFPLSAVIKHDVLPVLLIIPMILSNDCVSSVTSVYVSKAKKTNYSRQNTVLSNMNLTKNWE